MSLLYAAARPLLARLEPETAHRLTVRALALGLGPHAPPVRSQSLATTVSGLALSNPIGLAAGFDKDATVPDAALAMGFGFVEVGTLTPRPQSGNPRPRLFRLPGDEAVINRMGFNNRGHVAAHAALVRRAQRPGIVGVNLGANKDSPDPITDYVEGLRVLGPLASYVAVNVSSPNTPGLRGLQARAPLAALAGALAATRKDMELHRPLFLKIAPDLEPGALEDIIDIALSHDLDGLIISNTTLARPATLRGPHATETGGMSGKPLFAPSTALLAAAARLAPKRLVLIGVGGIGSGADAYAKIRAGASLVQLYTALVYQGPGLVPRIAADLAALLARDGFKTVADAVGTGLQ